MVITNTTFHVPAHYKPHLVTWLRDVYAKSATESGHSEPRIARVMGGGEDDGMSIAFQTAASTLAEAKKWHDGPGQDLRFELVRALGSEKVAFFTTYLQVID